MFYYVIFLGLGLFVTLRFLLRINQNNLVVLSNTVFIVPCPGHSAQAGVQQDIQHYRTQFFIQITIFNIPPLDLKPNAALLDNSCATILQISFDCPRTLFNRILFINSISFPTLSHVPSITAMGSTVDIASDLTFLAGNPRELSKKSIKLPQFKFEHDKAETLCFHRFLPRQRDTICLGRLILMNDIT